MSTDYESQISEMEREMARDAAEIHLMSGRIKELEERLIKAKEWRRVAERLVEYGNPRVTKGLEYAEARQELHELQKRIA